MLNSVDVRFTGAPCTSISRRAGSSVERTSGDRRAVDVARAPLQRADPGDELAEVEGLDQVVVGPGVETLDPVRRRVPRGEHEHRCRAVVAPGPGDDLEAADPGHPPVDDGDVVLVEAQLLDRLVAGRDGVDEVAGLLEALDQNLAEPAIVLRNEYAHQFIRLSARCATAAAEPTAAAEATTAPPNPPPPKPPRRSPRCSRWPWVA